MSVAGAGYLIGPVSGNQTYASQSFGSFFDSSVGQAVTATASVGPVQASSSSTTSLNTASIIQGVLMSENGIWVDNAIVSVALQVRDSDFNVHTLPTTVRIDVTPVSFAGSSVYATCVPASSTGQCIATATLPSSWFSAGGDGTASVSYHIGSGSQAGSSLGSIMVHATPASSVVTGVLLKLPLHDLYTGYTYSIPVVAYAGTYSINSFQLKIDTVASQVIITSLSVDGSVWAASTLVVSATEQIIVATPASPESRSVTASGPETLFSVNIQVLSTATVDATSTINCTVVSLFDSKGVSVYEATPARASYLDRSGMNGVIGSIFIANKNIVGMLPYAGQSEFVNSAVWTDQTISSNLYVLGVYPDGTLALISGGLSCSSDSVSALHVSPNCSSVFLDGSESSGSGRVNITVSFGLVSASVPFRVWYADAPLSFSIDDGILNAVLDWMNPVGCSQQYQSTHVHVNAVLRSGTSSVVVDVTDRVRSVLATTDSSIAQFIGGTNTLVGISTGTINVGLMGLLV